MNDILAVDRVYRNCSELLSGRVEMVAIDDPAGAAFNKKLRAAEERSRTERLESWAALLRILKTIRWHRAINVTPPDNQNGLRRSLDKVRDELHRVKQLADTDNVLDELVDLAYRMAGAPSPLAEDLIEQCEDIDPAQCLVVVSGAGLAQEYARWLAPYRIQVLSQSNYLRTVSFAEKAFLIGPPFFYEDSLLKAGRAPEIAINFPSWITRRKPKNSALDPFYEQRYSLTLKDFHVSPFEDSELIQDPREADEEILNEERASELQFDLFSEEESEDRRYCYFGSSSAGSIEARLFLLAGEKEVFLEVEGESVRCVDFDLRKEPSVNFKRIENLKEGDYLVLGMGENEKGVIYTKVAEKLPVAAQSQELWKSKLKKRIDRYGEAEVQRKLRLRGVTLHIRYSTWTEPFFIQPRNESHFRALLDYLDLPADRFVDNAHSFRAEMRREERENRRRLESLISHDSAEELQCHGFVYLNPEDDGSSGLFAGRLLASSREFYKVPKALLRVPRDSDRAIGLF